MTALSLKIIHFLIKINWKALFLTIIFLSLMAPVMVFSYNYLNKTQPAKVALSGEAEDRIYYPVTEVIDGDTISVKINGQTEQVRFLGINTPEITEPVECYGIPATNRLKQLIGQKTVFLLPDLQNTDRDIYGRLLRYVYLPDNTQLNGLLIKEGYAKIYDHFNIAYLNYYKKLQQEAKDNQRGLWKDCNLSPRT